MDYYYYIIHKNIYKFKNVTQKNIIISTFMMYYFRIFVIQGPYSNINTILY